MTSSRIPNRDMIRDASDGRYRMSLRTRRARRRKRTRLIRGIPRKHCGDMQRVRGFRGASRLHPDHHVRMGLGIVTGCDVEHHVCPEI